MNDEGRFLGRRILVVDDDLEVLESTSLVLRSEGADVVEAADGNTAVSYFTAQELDAVVLDMMLPGQSSATSLTDIRGPVRRELAFPTGCFKPLHMHSGPVKNALADVQPAGPSDGIAPESAARCTLDSAERKRRQ